MKRIFLTETQIKNILQESLSEILYHFTTLDNFKKIVSTDKIYLSESKASITDSYFSKNYPYYLSLTRSLSHKSGYPLYRNTKSVYEKQKVGKLAQISKSLNVRIEFDGRLLGTHFKGSPVNYHFKQNNKLNAQSFLKKQYIQNGHTEQDWKKNADDILVTARQDEDRLLSNKSYIEAVHKYITRVDILINLNGFSKMHSKKDLYFLLEDKNFGKYIYIYDDENYFNSYHNEKYINEEIIAGVLKRTNGKPLQQNNGVKKTKLTPNKVKLFAIFLQFIYIFKPSNFDEIFQTLVNLIDNVEFIPKIEGYENTKQILEKYFNVKYDTAYMQTAIVNSKKDLIHFKDAYNYIIEEIYKNAASANQNITHIRQLIPLVNNNF